MKILYLSSHNISRSIIAESITRKFSTQNVKPMSGASHPQEDIHPVAHRVLKENRYSSTNLVSKSWDTFTSWQPDIVITLCDSVLKQKCPAYVGKSVHVHWSLPNPAKQLGNMEENFQNVFLTLESRIKKMLEVDIEQMDPIELRAHLKKVAQ